MANKEYLNNCLEAPLIPEEFLDREVAIYTPDRRELLEFRCQRATASHFWGLIRSEVEWPRHLEFSLNTKWSGGWRPIIIARAEEEIEGLTEAVIEVATVGSPGVSTMIYRTDYEERGLESLSRDSKVWQTLRASELIPLGELPKALDFEATIRGFLGLVQEMSALQEAGELPARFPRPQFIAAVDKSG